MRNLVVISHTVRAHVRDFKKIGGRWAPAPLGWGVRDPKKHTRLCPMRVTILNLVVLGQTILALAGGPKIFLGCWSSAPWDGVAVTPRN